MRIIFSISALLFFITGNLDAQEIKDDFDKYWPQWRGPSASGTVTTGNPPIRWNEDLNVEWKAGIPGTGHATPIVWKGQIILLSAVKTDREIKAEEPEGDQPSEWMSPVITNFIHEFTVLSVDRKDGSIRWQKVVREELPHSHTHQFGSWASNSPVTDGERIYAYFGSHGLYCLTMDGEILWERDFGRMQKVRSFGEGCSPVLYENKLIVLRDHEGQSFLHVLDKNTGEDLLEIKRDEVSSWSTPYIAELNGKAQIITSATNKIRSYDLAAGNLLWECGGMTRNVIPSPVMDNGIVYLMSGFRGSALIAVDLSRAEGEISDSDAIIWKYALNTPYTPSPVLMDGKLYFLKVNNGYISCLDANDGKEYYSSQRLEGIQNIFTSPIGVRDRIYIAGTNGIFFVIRQGTDFEVLAKNSLDDSFYASPVVVGDNLYMRGSRYLYCVSEK